MVLFEKLNTSGYNLITVQGKLDFKPYLTEVGRSICAQVSTKRITNLHLDTRVHYKLKYESL